MVNGPGGGRPGSGAPNHMPQSQGPVQISPLPGCGPSLSLPLCRTRKQLLPVAAAGGASSAGPGGHSRRALAGLPGPARRQLPPLPRGRSERASALRRAPRTRETRRHPPRVRLSADRRWRQGAAVGPPSRLRLPGRGAARSGEAGVSAALGPACRAPRPSGGRAAETPVGVWGAGVAPRPKEAKAQADARASHRRPSSGRTRLLPIHRPPRRPFPPRVSGSARQRVCAGSGGCGCQPVRIHRVRQWPRAGAGTCPAGVSVGRPACGGPGASARGPAGLGMFPLFPALGGSQAGSC